MMRSAWRAAVAATIAVRATSRAVWPPVATPTATAVPVSPALVESTVPQSSSLVAPRAVAKPPNT
eukprot:scaffold35422_cov57-Phaeocystis_antarctica.AAC.2